MLMQTWPPLLHLLLSITSSAFGHLIHTNLTHSPHLRLLGYLVASDGLFPKEATLHCMFYVFTVLSVCNFLLYVV